MFGQYTEMTSTPGVQCPRMRVGRTVLSVVLFLSCALFSVPGNSAEPRSCDNGNRKSVIPVNENGRPLTPEELVAKPRLVRQLAAMKMTVKELTTCLLTGQAIRNHVVDFDEYTEVFRSSSLFALQIYDAVLWNFRKPPIDLSPVFRQVANSQPSENGLPRIELFNVTVGPLVPIQGVHFQNASVFIVNSRFPQVTIFRDVTFGRGVQFLGSRFGGGSSFENIVIDEWANFNRGEFGSGLFDNVTFRALGSFEGVMSESGLGFSNVRFQNGVQFDNALLGGGMYFHDVVVCGRASFKGLRSKERTEFHQAKIGNAADFMSEDAGPYCSRGEGTEIVDFAGARFAHAVSFDDSIFANVAKFQDTVFEKAVSFANVMFERKVEFERAHFRGRTSFAGALFVSAAKFGSTEFGGQLFFGEAEFLAGAEFGRGVFEEAVSFRGATVWDTLALDQTLWKGGADFRNTRISELRWSGDDGPSRSEGVVDTRMAWIGGGTIENVYFEDIVDFSYAAIGERRKVIFWNNVFEGEADFIRTHFRGDAIFGHNRFRESWDLTGTRFRLLKEGRQEGSEGYLCLALNRISRLYLEGDVLGLGQGVGVRVLFEDSPLKKSHIRSVHVSGREPECVEDISRGEEDGVVEALEDLYFGVAGGFRQNNDWSNENEAWYLGMVAKHQGRWMPWLLLDLPSRYGVDPLRVLGISVLVVLGFGFVFLPGFLLHLETGSGKLKVTRWRTTLRLEVPSQQWRVFRFRPMEPFFEQVYPKTRALRPLRDALFLSGRSFFKVGIGTTYPRKRLIVLLAYCEWLVGVYLLVHFAVAVKNTVPVALFFFSVSG